MTCSLGLREGVSLLQEITYHFSVIPMNSNAIKLEQSIWITDLYTIIQVKQANEKQEKEDDQSLSGSQNNGIFGLHWGHNIQKKS